MQAPPQDVTLGLNPWNIRDEQRLAQMSLMSLAEETGGAYSVNSNDFTKIYDRIVRDSSSYYLLGYYPTDERRNGSVRRIQVKVNRKDVNVFARKAYQAPKDKDEKKLTESAAGTSPEVRGGAQLRAADARPERVGARGAVQGHQQDLVGRGHGAGRRRAPRAQGGGRHLHQRARNLDDGDGPRRARCPMAIAPTWT